MRLSLSQASVGMQLAGVIAIAATAPRAPPALVIAVIVSAIVISILGTYVTVFENPRLRGETTERKQVRIVLLGATIHELMLIVSIGVALLAGAGKLTARKSTLRDVAIAFGALMVLALVWVLIPQGAHTAGENKVSHIYGIAENEQSVKIPLLALGGALLCAGSAYAVHRFM